MVFDYLIENSYITTEIIKNWGYEHPPRAIKDLTDSGINLIRSFITNEAGRRIARYTLSDPRALPNTNRRQNVPKALKNNIYNAQQGCCALCNGKFEPHELQADHKVPYLVQPDNGSAKSESDYMLLCGSCNRSKSWSCEHCTNGNLIKVVDTCIKCYWYNPLDCLHVALQQFRRADIIWQGDSEIKSHTMMVREAAKEKTNLPSYIKKMLAKKH